jgi:TRAP transporter 4TM/12TM fusion protein
MAVYQLLYTQFYLQGPDGHLITHLGFALVIVFLSMMLETRKGWYLKLVLLLSSLAVTGYLMVLLEDLLLYRTAVPAAPDLIVGTLVILVIIAGAFLMYGATFPIIALSSIAYIILGRYLPPPFTVAAVRLKRLLMWLSVTQGTDEGVYGNILGISAYYLFLFILFGSLLHAFGGTRFIINIGKWIGSKLRSGPAAVAVIGSSLLGTVTGSTVANITITGAFSIPMMKKAGYEPKQAAAIEAVSSNGGQIMPPIMGATAFVIVGFAGIPYIEIAIAAVVPALLYYFSVFLYVQLTARKMAVQPVVEQVNTRQLLLDAPIFFLPLGVLVFLLAIGFTLPYVAFWSLMTLIAVSLLSSIRKEARLSLKKIITAISSGVRSASELAILCGLVGVVATAIKVSGLGIKLPLVIEELSRGYIPIALLVAMVSSILLGMGVPTPAAYLLVAIGAVPALLVMGVPLLQAHLFCFIFAIFSHLTPPIAIGAIVASQIAGAKYWPTAWEAVKAGFTAFLLPFFIIYAPVIILRPDTSLILSIAKIVAILLAISSLQLGLSAQLFTALRVGERTAFIIVSLLCTIFIFGQNIPFLLSGAALFIVSIGYQFIRRSRFKTHLESTD